MSATFYEEIGGRATIERIVDVFYAGVATDALLRPMYPEEDLAPAAERFTLFLEQYWGGPTTYSETRGHPRLRMRHAPHTISGQVRDEWLLCMRLALAEQVADEPFRDALLVAFEHMAQHLINDDGSHRCEHGHQAT